MADGAPLKLIDIKRMLGEGAKGVKDASLAFTILPGQGGIPAASPEFLAANPQLTSNLPLPNKFSLANLLGTLGVIGDETVVKPGNKAISDRQDRGFFANTLKNRFQDAGL